jgi:hypothetical protein
MSPAVREPRLRALRRSQRYGVIGQMAKSAFQKRVTFATLLPPREVNDEKGRVVEQTTDATKFSDSGAEQDLPPGTISIVYDDAMHTKTTKYSFAGEGTMQIVLTQDENGATIAYSMDTASERGFSKFECEYDGHANWTSCTQFVEQEGRQFVKQRYRRTITYREGH